MRALILCFCLALLGFGLPARSLAASFDCAKAATRTEKAICADPELSSLDSALSVAYKQAMAATANKEDLKIAQRAWVKRRDACAVNACLKLNYMERQAELTPAQKPDAPTEQKPQIAQTPPSATESAPAVSAEEGWKRREALRQRLNWPAECEADFLEVYKSPDMGGMTPAIGDGSDGHGVELHALEGSLKLAVVQCGTAAYQVPFVVLLFDEKVAGSGKLLSFKQYDRETSGKVTVMESPDLAGWAEFSAKDKTLSVMTKARGIGDCGSYVTYAFKDGRSVVVEARAQACYDNEKKWVTEPGKWKKVEKP